MTINTQDLLVIARNGLKVALTRNGNGKPFDCTMLVLQWESIEGVYCYTVQSFNPLDNGKQLFAENDHILVVYLTRMMTEQDFLIENAQILAILRYLQDRRSNLTIESNSKTHAVFSGLIDTKSGSVDSNASIHWHYFGKQAVRTAYYACSKVSQAVYTWV